MRVVKPAQESPAYLFFRDLCAIPHGSFNMKPVADWLEAFGKNHGFETIRDKADNVIIKKPATPGYENKPGVILQGHTDMVCVAREGVEFDFLHEPLKLKLDGNRLTAEGTTLGADDGTAVAHMLGLLDEDDYVHGPLECVFTANEEVGLAGAMALDAAPLKGAYMIAMDSGAGDDNLTTVSCAGGTIMILRKSPVWEPAAGTALSLNIGGLKGGHSALCIHEERGNASKCLARILKAIADVTPMRIAAIEGGVKMNAIPAAASATITVGDETAAVDAAERIADCIRKELSTSDPGFVFSCEKTDTAAETLDAGTTESLMQMLLLIPSGVRSMSVDFTGLVAASNNNGVLRMNRDEIYIETCTRAAEDSVRSQIVDEIRLLAGMTGFSFEISSDFTGWKYEPESGIRDLAMKLYERKFGRPMEMVATHGGMEMGIFIAKLPHLQIFCCAPDCGAPHTPDEYLNIESQAAMYDYLKDVIEALAEL